MGENACMKSEVDVFRPIDVQVALEEGRWQVYEPLNTLSNASNMEFIIPGTSNEGVDLNNISLYLRAKITKADGTNLAAAETVQPVNNLHASLFRNVDLAINGQLLTRASREYAYKDLMLKMIRYDMPRGGKEDTYSRLAGYLPDTVGKQETLADNTNGKKRLEWIKESATFELRSRPCIDLFESDRLLIPGADMQLKFYFNDPSFYLCKPEATAADTFKLTVLEAQLMVRRVTIGDSFVKSIYQDITSKDALYPFVRREMVAVSIPQGLTQFTKENLFRGQLAVNYFVCMVHNEAYTGDVKRNPFFFQHFNLSEIALFENGQSVAHHPLKVDFSENRLANAYHYLLEANGAIGERACYPSITYEAFKNGSIIFCFTRSPDLSFNCAALPQHAGNLNLRLNFKSALAHPITVIVMAEFDSCIRINQYKNVVTDYAV